MTGDPASDGPGASTQRLDRWLWFSRILKSRTLAAALVEAGKVRVDAQRVIKPSHVIRIGAVLTIAVHETVRVVRVERLGTRRGPAAEARSLYEDLTPLIAKPVATLDSKNPAPERRPSKRDRRLLDRLKEPRP